MLEDIIPQGVIVKWGSSSEKKYTLQYESCDDFSHLSADVLLKHEGRMLKVKVHFKKACPGRRLSVAVLVFECGLKDSKMRAMRVCELAVPCNTSGFSTDEFCFVFPEKAFCDYKSFKIAVIAHYADFPQNICR